MERWVGKWNHEKKGDVYYVLYERGEGENTYWRVAKHEAGIHVIDYHVRREVCACRVRWRCQCNRGFFHYDCSHIKKVKQLSKAARDMELGVLQ